jgi:RND family efflux transporter MFP subunit
MKKLIFAFLFAQSLSLASIAPSRAHDLGGNGEYGEYGYDGFLEPAEDVLVSAVEIGRLERVNVKVGDRVVAGQEVARLEDDLQEISVEIAKQQALMKGEWEVAAAERTMQRNRRAQLQALVEQGTARPDELARAESDLAIAEARVGAAQEEQLSRQMEARRQEVQLERRRIVSPIKGIVARVMRQPGEYISPGESAVVRVLSKDSLVAVFNLPASDAVQLRVGQVVPLRPRTVPRAVEGMVESISPAIDGESGTVAVRIRIDNRDEILFPGDRCVMSNVRQLASRKIQGTSPTSGDGTKR